ncbi:hypothetical protein OE88DRAFT_1712289 [Heliocybe sulcata]|uniref:Rad9-domain-containing protein n=1 Tax=Heliocybe sulcata TaxID=5364 RepID=A0A5C3N2E6_9AGAM|nr:hypothetical protein OE88DRAFT_1712289 [Heliocybe sulcata]
MQATLDVTGLKPFTKALACLSKYGDDLTIYATPDSLSLSSTNSSMSAYARYKFVKQFFVRYNVGDKKTGRDRLADGVQEVLTVTGQLLTKSLLSILKHRTVEKSVSRCELSIVEGISSDPDDEDNDSLESKLIVRLHCKHGVIKTHRLLLLTPTSLLAPGSPSTLSESRLTIGPRSVKDMIEQFPSTKTAKGNPQLVWTFSHTDVHLKSVDSFFDSKAGAQLSTELTISADEFDVYDIYCPPITIAFHLREFNASIAFADSLALPLDLRFTDPLSPLYVDLGDDTFEALFVISTSQVHGAGGGASQSRGASQAANGDGPNGNGRKRSRDEDEPRRLANRKKPMKVVQRTDVPGYHRTSEPELMPPPSSIPQRRSPQFSQPHAGPSSARREESEPLFFPPSSLSAPRPQSPLFTQHQQDPEPLFLPGSQPSQAIVDSGLGIESMSAAEFEAMFEGDEEEMELLGSQTLSQKQLMEGGESSLQRGKEEERKLEESETESDTEPEDDSMSFELLPTQESREGDKSFRPLFED